MSLHFPTLGHRAWFAYQCLPRDSQGRPPSRRSLERRHGLANKDLARLIWDFYERPSYGKMHKFAAALGTTPEWLDKEEGPGPVTGFPVMPRPEPPKGMMKKRKSGPMQKVTEGTEGSG
jgi:hypothetical protein